MEKNAGLLVSVLQPMCVPTKCYEMFIQCLLPQSSDQE